MNELINLVDELRQLPSSSLVAVAYGVGPESNRAYLVIKPHCGLAYRVALPVGSDRWLKLIFQYKPTWTEDSGPDDTGRFSVFACSPMQFVHETLASASYWKRSYLGIAKPGELPWCRFVQATL
jgi:hypothetical protein